MPQPPNSATPDPELIEETEPRTDSAFSQIAGKVRENPKTAIAAGAAVAAGVVAAAAIGARSRSNGGKKKKKSD